MDSLPLSHQGSSAFKKKKKEKEKIYLFGLSCSVACGILSDLGSLHWEHGVLVTGTPGKGKSPFPSFLVYQGHNACRYSNDSRLWSAHLLSCLTAWSDFCNASCYCQDFPGGSDGTEFAYSVGDPGSIPGSGKKISWRREWLPLPVLLPEEFHGQRSRAGYSPWGHKESECDSHTNRLSD